MSNELNKDHMEENEALKIYELGFHFVPTIAEDDVAVQFSHLKSFIEKRGGEFISEESPKLIDLAYEISKTLKAQKKAHSKAYFGWVKFTLTPDQIEGLEKELKAFEPMLRYMLIKTVRENTMISNIVQKDGKRSSTKEADESTTDEKEIVTPVDEALIDKSIDELVKE